jgi:hypothetical protein
MSGNEPWQAPLLEGPLCKPGSVQEMVAVEDEVPLPEGATSLDFMQAVYRDPAQPTTRRMRAAVAALPFEHPKLSVNANIDTNFAARMEEIARLRGKSNVIDATQNYRTDTRRLPQPEPVVTDPSGGFKRRF